ncbi:hypothetical protein BLIG_01330 [Bifidobacterium longum subsp. infantis CCUG 52486]|uniref:Uncharacterized protein n=1 Tax=Bifidobacterium longum subsp. infantis CCUG 52486 TaxID=537937 RepID=C5EC48_BIFLI|nr:hypothetical protein BLIG_01330 [Bifidobacterium longum subsp. infantis CCUG 52486]
MLTSSNSSGVTRYMCSERHHHRPGMFHCRRTMGERPETRPENICLFPGFSLQ